MSARPSVSVVVASVNGFPWLAQCLDALAEHAPEAEVIVADRTGEATRARIGAGWPSVRTLAGTPEDSVPRLRALGIGQAGGDVVAVLEDHVVIGPGWLAALAGAHASGEHVAGGPVRNLTRSRLRDWAAFFCEYAGVMDPMPRGPVPGLPGMNVSYDRAALAEIEDLLAQARWETWLHPRLAERGMRFWCEPDAAVGHAKGFGFREFASQRWHYSRAHAGERNELLGSRRWIYFAGSPLLVPLLWIRLTGAVASRRRSLGTYLLCQPLVVAYLAVWAAGEAAGYALGGGRSSLEIR